MKKRRGIGHAVVKAMLGVVLFVGIGAGARAVLERLPWTRTVPMAGPSRILDADFAEHSRQGRNTVWTTYYAPDVSSTVPASLPTSTIGVDLSGKEPAMASVPIPTPTPTLALSDTSVEQSDTFAVVVANVPEALDVTATWSDRTYDFFKIGERWVGFLGADAKKTPGSYQVTVNIGTTTLREVISVAKRAFPVTVLAVTPELEEQGYTPPAIQSNVAAENERLNAALIYTPEARFSKPFTEPLDRISIVGAYGNIRKNGTVELQHLGADLDAPEGTPVYAINDGVVRLAEDFTNYGKTVVVDHGVGIFSFYLHLNEFNVKGGDTVTRGATIAYSGNTGYSIAPHLHFSVRIRNASVDPLRFIEAANAALTASP